MQKSMPKIKKAERKFLLLLPNTPSLVLIVHQKGEGNPFSLVQENYQASCFGLKYSRK